VWDQNTIVPVAKAYSGLSDEEIRELDAWIRRNTESKFGPVRSVGTTQVFELAFEGISASSRHKSGVAVRFPRIVRWRKDKLPKDADTLGMLQKIAAGKVA
jgi:DNA ligase-1